MDLHGLAGEIRQDGARIVRNAEKRRAVYDKVLRDSHGQNVAEVRDLLAREWREAFGEDMPSRTSPSSRKRSHVATRV